MRTMAEPSTPKGLWLPEKLERKRRETSYLTWIQSPNSAGCLSLRPQSEGVDRGRALVHMSFRCVSSKISRALWGSARFNELCCAYDTTIADAERIAIMAFSLSGRCMKQCPSPALRCQLCDLSVRHARELRAACIQRWHKRMRRGERAPSNR